MHVNMSDDTDYQPCKVTFPTVFPSTGQFLNVIESVSPLRSHDVSPLSFSGDEDAKFSRLDNTRHLIRAGNWSPCSTQATSGYEISYITGSGTAE